MPMKVRIDHNRCQGHGHCYALEPELFEPVDDDGHAGFRLDGPLVADAELQARLEEARANCPERAITIDERESARE